jgi:hypothetical protein
LRLCFLHSNLGCRLSRVCWWQAASGRMRVSCLQPKIVSCNVYFPILIGKYILIYIYPHLYRKVYIPILLQNHYQSNCSHDLILRSVSHFVIRSTYIRVCMFDVVNDRLMRIFGFCNDKIKILHASLYL